MAFSIKNLFRRKRQTDDDLDYEELGDTEKPEPIASTAYGALKPPLPEGTKIEPKVLIAVGGLLLFLLTFVVFYGMDEPAEKTTQQKAEEDFNKQRYANSSVPLDELNKLPNKYSSIKDQSATKDKKNTTSIQEPATNNLPMRITQPVIPTQRMNTPLAGSPYSSLAYMSQNTINPAEQEAAAARKSPIRFAAQAVEKALTGLLQPGSNDGGAYIAPVAAARAEAASDQEQKVSFIEKNQTSSSFYSRAKLQAPLSEFEIKAGTIIPGVMITGINSDLPGQIVGQVRENVYDSVSGQYLLIPLGSKLIGNYDSNMAYGQERVLVVWNRLLLPNGESMDLEGMVGADTAGYSGFTDRVNNHTPKVLNGVILGSLLTAAATMASGNNANATSYSQLAGQGVAENTAQAAAQITERNLNIQPTIEIRPGYAFNVFVNKDLILKPYQG